MQKFWNIFFKVAGVATLLGPFPSMVAPVKGTQFMLNANVNELPTLIPVVGHWGVMVVGIGVLIYMCSWRKELIQPILIYALIEKLYMVWGGIYALSSLPNSDSFLTVVVSDSVQIVGFIVYFIWKSQQSKKDTTALETA